MMVAHSVEEAIRSALPPEHPRMHFVLAVSGGLDSMVLLDAMVRMLGRDRAALTVATFDHRTGAAATQAVELVRDAARERSVPVVAGRDGRGSAGATAGGSAQSEEAWRDARWRFLRSVAADSPALDGRAAVLCTAHTRNDQVETVLMRALREAGARGLAGLEAPSPVLRPLLRCSRAEIRDYARVRKLRWLEDPSNASTLYLRNRVRLEMLPALEEARPSLADELIALGRDAAAWRRELDAVVASTIATRDHPHGIDVSRDDLAAYPAESIAMLWAAVAARAGQILDRRGAERVTRFILSGRGGSQIQLSGYWQLTRRGGWLELRRAPATSARRKKSAVVATETANLIGASGVSQ